MSEPKFSGRAKQRNGEVTIPLYDVIRRFKISPWTFIFSKAEKDSQSSVSTRPI